MEKISARNLVTLTFEPLSEFHFPLLLKWLEMPHVKTWWDQGVKWTPALIREKYASYVKGYKTFELEGQKMTKPVYAYIISLDQRPVGYVQYYDRHDFPLEQELNKQGCKIVKFPASCAGIDWYIGDPEMIGKGIGSKALKIFLELYVFRYFDHVLTDSDTMNTVALRTYEKAGFREIKKINKGEPDGTRWMIKTRLQENLPMKSRHNSLHSIE